MSLARKVFVNADQRKKSMQNEAVWAKEMVQQQCIGSAMKGCDSAKGKVPPCTVAVRLSQLFKKTHFSQKNLDAKFCA